MELDLQLWSAESLDKIQLMNIYPVACSEIKYWFVTNAATVKSVHKEYHWDRYIMDTVDRQSLYTGKLNMGLLRWGLFRRGRYCLQVYTGGCC